jgi:site-specific DNA-methyltransferase (adenine-specific)
MSWVSIPADVPTPSAEDLATMLSRSPQSRAWWSAVGRLGNAYADGTDEDERRTERAERAAWRRALAAHRRAARGTGPARTRAPSRSPAGCGPVRRARTDHRVGVARPRGRPGAGDGGEGDSEADPLACAATETINTGAVDRTPVEGSGVTLPPLVDGLRSASHHAARIIHGDAVEVLASLPEASFEGAVTDPPHEVLDQDWDRLPPVELWRAVLRVLKPGAALVAIGAARTYHRMVAAIESAGFIIEDMAVWAFATGRPPGTNRLKPGHAPILIARKPGPRVPMNIDESRLPYVDAADADQTRRIGSLRRSGNRRGGVYHASMNDNGVERGEFEPKAGRWPPNVMITDPSLGDHDRFFLIPKLRDPTGHPAAKPVQLVARLVCLFVTPGGTVLDPFGGGGATGVAAIATGRRALLIEREPEFVALTERNLAAARVGDLQDLRKVAHSAGLTIGADDDGITRNNEGLQAVPERASVESSTCLLTPRQMAIALGVSTRTLHRWTLDFDLPCIRRGSRVTHYDPDEVRAALAEKGKRTGERLPRPKKQVARSAGEAQASGRHDLDPVPTVPDTNRGPGRGSRARRGGRGRDQQASAGPRPEPTASARGGRSGPGPVGSDEGERLRAAADAAALLRGSRRPTPPGKV